VHDYARDRAVALDIDAFPHRLTRR
jgi:hypothetical protein